MSVNAIGSPSRWIRSPSPGPSRGAWTAARRSSTVATAIPFISTRISPARTPAASASDPGTMSMSWMPVHDDRFEIRFHPHGWSEPQPVSLEFDRNRTGAITGFGLSSGSERGIVFEKHH